MMRQKTIIFLLGMMTVSMPVLADSNDLAYYQKHKAELISKDRAQQIAKTQVSGSKVHKMEFEYDDGQAYYDVDVIRRGIKYEVKVDAVTGKVLKVEQDD